MPDIITGTHLQPEDLDGQDIMHELGRFGQWTHAEKFEPLSTEVEKCKHKDRERKLEPVLKQLGYTLKQVKYQILRQVSRSYIDAGAPAYLIPVWIESPASGTVYDPSTSPVTVKVGQRVYFESPIFVEPGLDFLLITSR